MPEETNNTTTSTSDTITPLDELIAEARAALTTQHETAKKQHFTQSRADADAAWEKSERERKIGWCKQWWNENFYPLSDPYQNFRDEDYVREYLPYEGRADALCRAGLPGEGLRVWLYRRGGKASVAEVQAWMEPLVPWTVYGGEAIALDKRRSEDRIIVHAEGLSAEMRKFLERAWMIEVQWRVVSAIFHRYEREHPECW